MKSLLLLVLLSFVSVGAHATPSILFVDTDKKELNMESYNYLKVWLIATDTNGLETLAGAAILDPVSHRPYGVLQAGTQKGAYEIILDSIGIQQVRGIDPFAATRDFVVRVYNSKGETAETSLQIEQRWEGSHLSQYKKIITRGFIKSISAGLDYRGKNNYFLERIINGKEARGVVREFTPSIVLKPSKSEYFQIPGDDFEKNCQVIKNLKWDFNANFIVNATSVVDTCTETIRTLKESCEQSGRHLTFSDRDNVTRSYSCDGTLVKMAVFGFPGEAPQEIFVNP